MFILAIQHASNPKITTYQHAKSAKQNIHGKKSYCVHSEICTEKLLWNIISYYFKARETITSQLYRKYGDETEHGIHTNNDHGMMKYAWKLTSCDWRHKINLHDRNENFLGKYIELILCYYRSYFIILTINLKYSRLRKICFEKKNTFPLKNVYNLHRIYLKLVKKIIKIKVPFQIAEWYFEINQTKSH